MLTEVSIPTAPVKPNQRSQHELTKSARILNYLADNLDIRSGLLGRDAQLHTGRLEVLVGGISPNSKRAEWTVLFRGRNFPYA